jgi:hypothetical protein
MGDSRYYLRNREKYENTDVKCPFYHYEKYSEIRCEGCYNGVTTALVFHDTGKLEKHQDNYCKSNYKDCPVYQMIIKKY